MDAFDIYAKITLDSSEYDKGLASAGKDATGFAKILGNAGKSTQAFSGDMGSAGASAMGFAQVLMGNLATKAVEFAIGALKKLGEVAVNVFKESISAYSDFQQLVGGVETLFKTSAGKVQKYAADAYKTAGLSANEYMETVTSFSASLLQSLGGDTETAADVANQAIIDMADNANKMGTTISMIQSAYTGFAKQNYTMLDNLKLGYGGTKEEMERLLEDAEAIKAKNGEVVDYSIESYADIIEAIHVVQTEMGITGTTADEAGETVTGSLGSVKAAWKNLVTGIASDNADLDKLMEDFVEAAKTYVDNLTPVIERAIDNLIEVIERMLPTFIELGLKVGGALLKGLIKGLGESLLGLLLLPLKPILKPIFEAEQDANMYRRANGGFMQAGQPYRAGEFGAEVIVPARDSYAYTASETAGMFGRGITININGDVYDDENSMARKLKNAVVDIVGTELAYG